MLGSFGSSSHEEEDDPHDQLHHQIQHNTGGFQPPSPAVNIRQLLVSCGEMISRSDLAAAHRLLNILSANSSPCGDSTERLVHQFTKALSLRLSRCSATLTGGSIPPFSISDSTSYGGSRGGSDDNAARSSTTLDDNRALVQSSYLTLNQVTPFIRFSHLTANQAILEAIDQGQQAIHVIDFDIMHGVQWPLFMRSLVDRYPTPSLRITGTGNDLETLYRTGDRLTKFANSLGLRFQFHPLLLSEGDDPISSVASGVILLPDETLAVNCVLYLHRLLKDRERLRIFLQRIKAMDPKVVTIAETEANHNHPFFLQRFVAAVDFYAAVFDSLEATLPPSSHERLTVEQVWFGREIVDIVAAEGKERRERHERFRSWEVILRSTGFKVVPLSPFALSQAKLLLKLHYPSEGYQLIHASNDAFFLGWQNQPLFSVSSWR